MFDRIVARIDIVERALISLCFALMLLFALAQIVARNLFDYGFIWVDDAIKVLVLWVAMLGALYATKKAKHITIDVASRFLPRSAAKWLRRILFLLTAAICFIAAYYSWQFVLLEIEDPLIAFLNVPTWVCELIIPASLLGMAIRFVGLAFSVSANAEEQP
ncbi:MAG: TRAP transporter small permease [Aestuariibacter sp.]